MGSNILGVTRVEVISINASRAGSKITTVWVKELCAKKVRGMSTDCHFAPSVLEILWEVLHWMNIKFCWDKSVSFFKPEIVLKPK